MCLQMARSQRKEHGWPTVLYVADHPIWLPVDGRYSLSNIGDATLGPRSNESDERSHALPADESILLCAKCGSLPACGA